MIGLLVLGLIICKDYGVSWDERQQRDIGTINLDYIHSGNDSLMAGFADRDHGAAFEVPLRWVEERIKPSGLGGVYYIRHISTYIFFLLGIWCAYLLAHRLFNKQWIALAGIAMLVLSPRIFAHAFLNSKDVPFLLATLIALYAITLMFEKRRWYLYALAGLACGYAMGIRTMGGLLAIMTFAFIVMDIIILKEKRRAGLGLLIFATSTAGMLYLCWPALWHHPVDNLIDSYQKLAHFDRWGGKLLFNGKEYADKAIPWYYIPEWFIISTPILWLILGLVGLEAMGIYAVKHPMDCLMETKGRVLLLCIGTFIVPVAAIIVLHSVVYDDWRHVYFIYGPFVILALYGLEQISRYKIGRVVVKVGVIVQALAAGAFMVMAHPFQQVYFNPLVSHKPEYLRLHYDYDYWGASFKQGLEYLLRHNTSDSIPVLNSLPPLWDNWTALDYEDRKRIKWVETYRDGAYFLTIYRNHPQDYGPPFRKVHGIQVGNSTVMQIYRIDSTMTK